MSIWPVFTPPQRSYNKRECDEACSHYPAMDEPKRVDPRPLRVEPRVGDRNGIAGRKTGKRLLGRIHDAVKTAVLVREFKYRIDLSGVRALEADYSSPYIGRFGRRALVSAVD